MMSPASTTSPTFTSGRWLMQVFWFERWNFCRRVDIDARLAGFDIAAGADHDTRGVDLIDDAAAQRANRSARIARHGFFHAGADERRFGLDQRHGLTLHVRAHQRAVGVIVFQERNQRGSDRNQLLGADVHQRDGRAAPSRIRRFTRRDQFFDEASRRRWFRPRPAPRCASALPLPKDRPHRRSPCRR
jgi:hypothetical protein